MKDIKQLILTLVALLAVTTGAWAETGENIFQYCYDCQRNPAYPKTTASASLSGFENPLVGYNGSGFDVDNTSAGPWKLEYMGLWSTTNQYGIGDIWNYQDTYNCTDVPVFRLYQWNATANEYQHAAYGVVCAYAKVSNAVEHTAFFEAEGGWGCVLTNSSHSSSMNITFDEDLTTGLTTLIAAATPSGPEVAWDKDKKTGSFTMPGGNVTLEPDYYPQATVADGGVTAADADARATTDDPLVKVDATKLTGAKKLMYFVSNSGTTAPAYDAKGWTDQLPTAEGLAQQGIVYVWYYPVGTDEGVDGATATYSDGDIMPLGTNGLVTIAAAPTYAVTFAEGVNPESPAEPEWTASPATGVTKGQTVTVTYTGSKKVIGVKAEKKAAAPAETTVTLTPGEIGGLISGGSSSKTINGITIAVSGDANFHSGNGWMEVSAFDLDTMEPIPATGTYTFTSSVGKIKRIDINHTGGNWWEAGAGWPGSYVVDDTSTFTWSGTPAASVTLNGSDNCSLYSVSSFVFTIEPTN